jgi:hypothetical protein
MSSAHVFPKRIFSKPSLRLVAGVYPNSEYVPDPFGMKIVGILGLFPRLPGETCCTVNNCVEFKSRKLPPIVFST